MTYNELADILDEMTDEQRKSTVRVRIGTQAKDSCDVRDFKIDAQSLLSDNKADIFFVL